MPARLAFACSTVPDLLSIKKIHRRTNPASSSYVVTATDGSDYVMKVFPQWKASIAARSEVFSSVIGMRLGLSMAHWRILQLDDQIITGYRTAGKSQEDAAAKLSEGLYFGSRYGASHGYLVPFLPPPLDKMNPEVARQLGCIRLFDVWIGNSDMRRPAIVLEDDYPAHTYFHSHAHVFESEADDSANRRACEAYTAACEIAGNVGVVNSFVAKLCTLTRADLHAAFNDVPAFWRHIRSEKNAVAFLEGRRDWIRGLARLGFNLKMANAVAVPTLTCDTGQVKIMQSPMRLN